MLLPRAQLLAVLIAIEVAIVISMVVAIRGDASVPWSWGQDETVSTATGPHLAEGGPAQTFAVGARPGVTIDIGYADLTIATGAAGQIGVSVSKSATFGPFRAKAPITARQEGGSVHVTAGDDSGVVVGDMRRVTLTVPADTAVTVINAGDINAVGLRAIASFHSNNGDIKIDDFNAPRLDIQSTRNGDVTLHGIVAAHLNVTSSNGDIEGSDLHVSAGRIDSHDGSVKLGFASGTDAMIVAQAGGRVRVGGFPSSAFVAPSGNATNADNNDSSTRTVRAGSGSGRIYVNSGSDDVDIDQEG